MKTRQGCMSDICPWIYIVRTYILLGFSPQVNRFTSRNVSKRIKGERDKTLRPADNAEDATDPWTNLKTTTRRARDRKDSVTRILRMVKR